MKLRILYCALCILISGCTGTQKTEDSRNEEKDSIISVNDSSSTLSGLPIDQFGGINDTLGAYLHSEYPVYSTQTSQVTLFLYNRMAIEYGADYFIAYEDEQGVWRKLLFPDNFAFLDMLYRVRNNDCSMLVAWLFPELNNNRPGRYRYYHRIRNVGLMMAEFRLSDDEEECKNAKKTALPEEYQKCYNSIEEKVYDMVEEMPEFPGGREELDLFIHKNLSGNITKEGRVIVHFIVEKDGKVDHIEVVRSPDEELSREAIKIVNRMPRWICGKHCRRKVRVNFTIPINFRKTEDSER